MDTTKVVFRKYHNGDILALFPELAGDVNGFLCLTYEHVGQHGHGDYDHCINITTPAKPHEFRELKKELERIGYKLRVMKRINHVKAYQLRRAEVCRHAG